MPQPTSQYNPSSSFTWLSHNVRYPSSALTYRGKALSACPNVLFRAPIRAFPHHGKAFSAHRRKPIETAINASRWYSTHCANVPKFVHTEAEGLLSGCRLFSASWRSTQVRLRSTIWRGQTTGACQSMKRVCGGLNYRWDIGMKTWTAAQDDCKNIYNIWVII